MALPQPFDAILSGKNKDAQPSPYDGVLGGKNKTCSTKNIGVVDTIEQKPPRYDGGGNLIPWPPANMTEKEYIKQEVSYLLPINRWYSAEECQGVMTIVYMRLTIDMNIYRKDIPKGSDVLKYRKCTRCYRQVRGEKVYGYLFKD